MSLFPIHSRREGSKISSFNANMRSNLLNMRKKPVAPVAPVAHVAPIRAQVVPTTKTSSSPINKILKANVIKKL